MLAAKRIFRYLQGTKDFGLPYKRGDLFGFTDSDFPGDHEDRKSTSGYVFLMGTAAVSWLSKKQAIVGATIIFCDNNSAIKRSRNPVLHGRSKHINVKYHFLRNLCNDGAIELVYCKSEDQVADVFTKALKSKTFEKLRRLLGICTLN